MSKKRKYKDGLPRYKGVVLLYSFTYNETRKMISKYRFIPDIEKDVMDLVYKCVRQSKKLTRAYNKTRTNKL